MKSEKEILEELARLRDQLPVGTTIEDLIEKTQEVEKAMKKEPRRKQVGSTIDTELWARLRAQAIIEGRNSGDLLDDAIKLYLDSKKNLNTGDQERT